MAEDKFMDGASSGRIVVVICRGSGCSEALERPRRREYFGWLPTYSIVQVAIKDRKLRKH